MEANGKFSEEEKEKAWRTSKIYEQSGHNKNLTLQDEAVGWEKNIYRYCHLAEAKIKEMTPK